MSSNDTQHIYSSEYGGQGEPIPASKISYDNTESGLQATKVQAAIDELAGDIAGLTGEDVAYDNTESGLSATDVQGAIDELAGDISDLAGDDVSYDNTVSGLSATNVQSAIDEIVAGNLPKLPDAATAGTYVLKATKADDTVTYAWVLEV